MMSDLSDFTDDEAAYDHAKENPVAALNLAHHALETLKGETLALDDLETERLGEIVRALKDIESTANDLRKESFGSELKDRTEPGDRVAGMEYVCQERRYVKDSEQALAEIVAKGGNPADVVSKVPVGRFETVSKDLGISMNEHIDTYESEFYKRL